MMRRIVAETLNSQYGGQAVSGCELHADAVTGECEATISPTWAATRAMNFRLSDSASGVRRGTGTEDRLRSSCRRDFGNGGGLYVEVASAIGTAPGFNNWYRSSSASTRSLHQLRANDR
jgi:hypothetical protein